MLDRYGHNRLAMLAAKGLMLSAVCLTAALALWSPTSLTARAADGALGDWLSVTILSLSAVAWAELIWCDVLGRSPLRLISHRRRHSMLVLLYASIAGFYGVFAFAAASPHVHTSLILVVDYIAVSVFGGALTVSIAKEPAT